MKKKILSATLTMTMVLALTACGSSASSEDNSGGGEGGKDGATIQVIPMSTASAYWLAVKQGAEDAAADLKEEYGEITIDPE